jgi:hypothetical protein
VKARQCNTHKSKFAIMMKSITCIYWYFIKQYILEQIQLYHRNSYTASCYPPFLKNIIPAYINRYIYIYMCVFNFQMYIYIYVYTCVSRFFYLLRSGILKKYEILKSIYVSCFICIARIHSIVFCHQ